MSFELQRNQSLGENLSRLAHRRIEHALSCFQTEDDESVAIHSVRKDIKKLRALLRLVRKCLEKGEYRRSMADLRSAADIFAAVRDAKVRNDTFSSLIDKYGDQLPAAASRKMKQQLQSTYSHEVETCMKKGCRNELHRIFASIEKRIDKWRIQHTWESIGAGVNSSYRLGRKRFAGALESQSVECFHEWRKRAKDLWYHVRLLRPLWPGYFEMLACELERLSDALGEDHDLAVLHDTFLEPLHDKIGKDILQPFNQAIQASQNELRVRCIHIGRRVYAEKAADFCPRVELYWHIWQAE